MDSTEVRFAVLVLAAGESRRFGNAKQLALVEGEPLLRYVLKRICSHDNYQLVVVLGARHERIRPVISDLEIDVLVNTEWQKGMSSSLRNGLQYVELRYPHLTGIIVVLGDQWKLDETDLLALLAEARIHTGKIVAADYDGQPGVPVYFPREKWDLLRSLEGDIGAKEILSARTDVVRVQLPNARVDLDIPESGNKF